MSKNHSAEFKRCMDTLDVAQARRLWRHVCPHLPQPSTDKAMLAQLHMARTMSPLMTRAQRFYSHRYLLDHGMPSGLPDEMKPLYERLYPRVETGVGLALHGSGWFKPAIPLVGKAMTDSIQDTLADGVKDPVIIRERMLDAGEKEKRALFGRVLPPSDDDAVEMKRKLLATVAKV